MERPASMIRNTVYFKRRSEKGGHRAIWWADFAIFYLVIQGLTEFFP